MKFKVIIPKFLSRYHVFEEVLSPLTEIMYVDYPSLRKQFSNADGIVWITGKITEEMLLKSKKLKIVARYGVGYDECDFDAMTRHQIYLTHTPNVLSDSVADMTLALLLTCNRKLIQADKFVRKNWLKEKSSQIGYGVDLRGKTMGIIGLGRIGFQVAYRCFKGFDMKIIYSDIQRNLIAEQKLGAKKKSLTEVMKESDFISINVALTPQTYRMITEKHLRLMNKTAIILNTSRGSVIDQKALTKILYEKGIAGAGLDVFEKEPISDNDPLLNLQNVVLSPHISSATEEAREGMAICNADDIVSVLKGEIPPPNVVSEQKGMKFYK